MTSYGVVLKCLTGLSFVFLIGCNSRVAGREDGKITWKEVADWHRRFAEEYQGSLDDPDAFRLDRKPILGKILKTYRYTEHSDDSSLRPAKQVTWWIGGINGRVYSLSALDDQEARVFRNGDDILLSGDPASCDDADCFQGYITGIRSRTRGHMKVVTIRDVDDPDLYAPDE
jgi:hypothetical protein